jgi:hypothetical protein
MAKFFSKESIIARPGFNRWRVPPASIAIHLCIGSVYAWSIFNPALTRIHGVVVDGLGDWTLKQTVTLPKLMEIAPPGTINPASTLYNSTMVFMACLLAIAPDR